MNQPAEPFWQYVPKILAYPLKGENAIAIGVLGLLGWLCSGLFLLGSLVWVATYNFAYGVLTHTASGNLEPRTGYFDQMGSSIAWQQFLLWVILGIPVALVHINLGVIAALCALAVMLAILPVATMALAMDQNLFSALNPVTWIAVSQILGSRYLMLLAICGGILAASFAAASLLSFIPLVGSLGGELVSRYAIVAIFYLLGYVIYQYHDDFGMGLTEDFRIQRPRQPLNDPTVLQAQALLDKGDAHGARQLLHRSMAERGPLSPPADALLQLAVETDDAEGQVAVIRQRLIVHLADDEFDESLKLLGQAQALDENFLMPDPDLSLALCKHLLNAGDSHRAITMAQGFVRQFPGHKDVVGHAYLTAQIFTNKLGRDADALKVLDQLISRYKDHPQIATMQAERERVASLMT
ncbi:MAG: hypothetical protein AB8B96_02020 [Lysobacterales bacterium]